MLRKQNFSRRAGLRKRLTESRRPLHLRRRHRGVSRLIEQIERDEYFNNYEYLNEGAFLRTLGKTFSDITSDLKDKWKKNKEVAEYDIAEEERQKKENKEQALRKRDGQRGNKKGVKRFKNSFAKQKKADANFASKENSRRKDELNTIKELKRRMEKFKQKSDKLQQEKKELMAELRKQPQTIQKMFKDLQAFNFTKVK